MSNPIVNKPRPTALGVPYEAALEIGARLKAARERLGRTPNSVAARIKIREHYITAIEQGQWNELPPGLNGRGLVRIYAREMDVEVTELEPRSAPTATHPQYEPTAQISVISRQALMERELARASQDLARTVSRGNGGNLHSNPRPQLGAPYSGRLAHRTPPATQAPGSLGLPVQRNSLDARAQEIIQRNAATTADRLRAGSGSSNAGGAPSSPSAPNEPRAPSRSDHEDESPLDVLTPDVASILGLSELDLAPRETLRPAPPPVPVRRDVPDVSAESMAAEMFGGFAPAETPFVVPAPGRRADFEDPPETVPISRLFHEPPVTTLRPHEALEPEDEVAKPRSLDEVPVAPPVPASTVSAMAASLREPHQVNSAIQSDWPQTGVTAEAVKAANTGRTTARGLSGKTLLGYTAAALALVGLGAFFFARQSIENGVPENGAVVGGRAPVSSEPSPNTNSLASGTIDTAEGTTEGAAPAVAVPEAVATDAAADAGVPQVAGPEAAVTTAPAPVPTAAAETATEAEAAPASQNVETSILGTGAVRQAKLTLTESVEIQVTADGKRIYSGTRPAGVLTIDFAKTAEIFVNDGSKAKLAYGKWDHGALGHPGRKRRIFLNASAFAPPR